MKYTYYTYYSEYNKRTYILRVREDSRKYEWIDKRGIWQFDNNSTLSDLGDQRALKEITKEEVFLELL